MSRDHIYVLNQAIHLLKSFTSGSLLKGYLKHYLNFLIASSWELVKEAFLSELFCPYWKHCNIIQGDGFFCMMDCVSCQVSVYCFSRVYDWCVMSNFNSFGFCIFLSSLLILKCNCDQWLHFLSFLVLIISHLGKGKKLRIPSVMSASCCYVTLYFFYVNVILIQSE